MAETIQLEVVTPERLVVNDTAEYIEIPGKTGYIGVLPGHAPLITELAVGEISYRTGSETRRLRGALPRFCKIKSPSWLRPRRKLKRSIPRAPKPPKRKPKLSCRRLGRKETRTHRPRCSGPMPGWM